MCKNLIPVGPPLVKTQRDVPVAPVRTNRKSGTKPGDLKTYTHRQRQTERDMDKGHP